MPSSYPLPFSNLPRASCSFPASDPGERQWTSSGDTSDDNLPSRPNTIRRVRTQTDTATDRTNARHARANAEASGSDRLKRAVNKVQSVKRRGTPVVKTAHTKAGSSKPTLTQSDPTAATSAFIARDDEDTRERTASRETNPSDHQARIQPGKRRRTEEWVSETADSPTRSEGPHVSSPLASQVEYTPRQEVQTERITIDLTRTSPDSCDGEDRRPILKTRRELLERFRLKRKGEQHPTTEISQDETRPSATTPQASPQLTDTQRDPNHTSSQPLVVNQSKRRKTEPSERTPNTPIRSQSMPCQTPAAEREAGNLIQARSDLTENPRPMSDSPRCGSFSPTSWHQEAQANRAVPPVEEKTAELATSEIPARALRELDDDTDSESLTSLETSVPTPYIEPNPARAQLLSLMPAGSPEPVFPLMDQTFQLLQDVVLPLKIRDHIEVLEDGTSREATLFAIDVFRCGIIWAHFFRPDGTRWSKEIPTSRLFSTRASWPVSFVGPYEVQDGSLTPGDRVLMHTFSTTHALNPSSPWSDETIQLAPHIPTSHDGYPLFMFRHIDIGVAFVYRKPNRQLIHVFAEPTADIPGGYFIVENGQARRLRDHMDFYHKYDFRNWPAPNTSTQTTGQTTEQEAADTHSETTPVTAAGNSMENDDDGEANNRVWAEDEIETDNDNEVVEASGAVDTVGDWVQVFDVNGMVNDANVVRLGGLGIEVHVDKQERNGVRVNIGDIGITCWV